MHQLGKVTFKVLIQRYHLSYNLFIKNGQNFNSNNYFKTIANFEINTFKKKVRDDELKLIEKNMDSNQYTPSKSIRNGLVSGNRLVSNIRTVSEKSSVLYFPFNTYVSIHFQEFHSTNNIFSVHAKNIESEHDGQRKKVFTEYENKVLRQILLDYDELKDTMAPEFKNINEEEVNIISDSEFEILININHEHLNKSEILENFRKITYYMYDKDDNLSHGKFDNISYWLIESIKDLSNEDICSILYLLQLWSVKCFRTDTNFYQLFQEIDKQLINRLYLKQYSLQELLLIIDYWSNLNLIRSSNFCKLSLKKLLQKSHQISGKQFVQLLLYHCSARTFNPIVSSYDIEYNFQQKFDSLNANDVAIVCLAFFKSEKKLVNTNLILKVARMFVNNIETMNDVCVNGYLKTFRYWFPLDHWNVLYEICNTLYKHIDKMSRHVIPHAALLGTRLDVYHSKLLDKIIEKTIENKDKIRIKDFEKLLFTVVLFDHKLKENHSHLFNIIIDQFLKEERQYEINKYPKVIINVVYNLILKNIYNFQLIEKCLDLDFLEQSFGKRLSGYVLPRQLLAIDYSIDIECPEYIGSRLPESLKHKLCKHYAWRKPGDLLQGKEIKSDELLVTIHEHLEKLLGSKKCVHLAYILPYFIRPDLLICLSNDGKPLPIPESMSDLVYFNAYPPPNIGTWYVFLCVPFSHLIKNSHNQFKGPYLCKIRQLKELGYVPIVINAFEWINESQKSRDTILQNKLNEGMESKIVSVSE